MGNCIVYHLISHVILHFRCNSAMLICDEEFIIIISFSVGGHRTWSFRLRLPGSVTYAGHRRNAAERGSGRGSRKGQVSWSSADKNVEAAA